MSYRLEHATNGKQWHVLWPERGWVTNLRVQIWYEDAVADGQVEGGAVTFLEMAHRLSDAGLLTFGVR